MLSVPWSIHQISLGFILISTLPGFIAEKASLFFLPLDQALGMNKDKYKSSSSNICCFKILFFFENLFKIILFVSLFYLLSRQMQIGFADLASQLVLLKYFSFLTSLDLGGTR